MSEPIMMIWTTGSIEEARRVSRFLVQERIIACASIIPWVESIFMWNNQLDTAQETKVLLKTRRDKFDEAKQIILENSSYEVPEVTAIPIEMGNQAYFDWIDDTLLAKKDPEEEPSGL